MKILKYLSIIILILSVLLITGCGKKDVDVTIKTPDVGQINVPKIQPLHLIDVEWIVLNKERVRELASQTKDINPLFSITSDDYEKMSRNMVEIRRYIGEQKAVITYLTGFIDSINKPKTSNDKK